MSGFAQATRRKIVQLPTGSKLAGEVTAKTLTWQLPKTGLLARLWLHISGTVVGTITDPNALGFSSVLSRVRLSINSGIDVFNCSGAGFHYLLRPCLETELVDAVGIGATARSAVAASAYNISVLIPVAINMRDPLGLLLLQNEQTIATLSVELAADASIATGVTSNAVTVVPYMEVFTVPSDPKDYPPLNVVHQILEDSQVVSGAGDVAYSWPRGNTYIQCIHGLGVGVSGSDLWSRLQVKVNQSERIYDTDVGFFDFESYAYRGVARIPGAIPVDLIASSGLGSYGQARDLFNSALVTDLQSVITATGAGTLYTVRRQLVMLG